MGLRVFFFDALNDLQNSYFFFSQLTYDSHNSILWYGTVTFYSLMLIMKHAHTLNAHMFVCVNMMYMRSCADTHTRTHTHYLSLCLTSHIY